MITILIISIFLLVLTIAFKKQIKGLINRHLIAKIFKYFLIALLSLFSIFSIVMGGGEMFSGDLSGIAHLITALPASIIIVFFLK